MTKDELIKKVLGNPEPACKYHCLTCYGGFNGGDGFLSYQCGEDREMHWMFLPNSATNSSYEVSDEFVVEVISDNFKKLKKYYK